MNYLNAYPAARSILIIDNVSFHHNIFFKELIKTTGTIIVYLPPYNPMINLTE